MKHPHAELMMQYAQDAMDTETPWERWELHISDNVWVPMSQNPEWCEYNKYRRKPRTININGFEVPEPVRYKPEYGTFYFCPSLSISDFYNGMAWTDSSMDFHIYEHGLLHLDSESAILHAKALLSFTERK